MKLIRDVKRCVIGSGIFKVEEDTVQSIVAFGRRGVEEFLHRIIFRNLKKTVHDLTSTSPNADNNRRYCKRDFESMKEHFPIQDHPRRFQEFRYKVSTDVLSAQRGVSSSSSFRVMAKTKTTRARNTVQGSRSFIFRKCLLKTQHNALNRNDRWAKLGSR